MISIDEVKRLASAGGYKRIPISRELYADRRTPVEVLRILSGVSEDCFLLESREDDVCWGRYTYLGFSPVLKLACQDGTVTITGGKRTRTKETGRPKEVIRQILKDYRSPRFEGMPGFTGGFAGYFSYDYRKYAEMPDPGEKREGREFLDARLMLFDRLIAFDHFRQKIILIANVDAADPETSYLEAERGLEEMEELIRKGAAGPERRLQVNGEPRPVFDREDYSLMAEMCREYIRSNDSFWMMLANGMEAEMEGSILDLYRALRVEYPSPYLFYFTEGGMEAAGAASGTLVKLEKEKLSTSVEGSKNPRGESRKDDLRLERELLADGSQRAWHNLLVDLSRNDLGKTCRNNTVKLEPYMGIGKQDHGMYLYSVISGRIKKGMDGLDAAENFLPAGRFTGAPKRQNSRLLEEIEQNERGLFGGAAGYLDFSGNMDLCAPEQLAYQKNGRLVIRSIARIMADSDPAEAYGQCMDQAEPMLRALDGARKGEEV